MQWKRHFLVFVLIIALFVSNFVEAQRSGKKKKGKSKSKDVISSLTLPENDQQDVCKQPKEVGPCKGKIKRYYFKKESGKCKSFNFGGCGGNENNFTSRSACRKRCGGKTA
uniref:HcKuPI n=1 Tax=Sinohyriopsis cumingii TaxID=165450 RepID=A0A7G3FWH5_SINCU|nr:HcKuPI [Sinohyriopsis cumingii]